MEPVRRPRVLAEIDPHSEWVHGREFDTLVVDVTGFGKDHLKVQVEPSGSLKITGERAVDGSGRQWLHFTKRFDLPSGCCGGDAAAIKVPRPLVGAATPAGAAGNGGSSDDSERYEDAVRGGGEDEAGDGDGWNIGGRVAAVVRREEQSTLRRLAGGLSRHRQVVLNVVLAVVLLWLVAFGAKNKPGAGGQAD
ncbi:hypothetical protein HU200_022050 [Digitaria exilis]|uniref:SHSP domain-containing protein n=1 Tax=Digitaria exilis TaxID=1010633 RepID=A0A835C7X6_9POAL|nr:hypothetical protein HU200_022050 [Digitaria exilis]